ncbi:MAG: hypothetical protein EAX91_02135 [Candidatus Lokiarchaeota archaeon]|nr:hypothetical protein [Candidatus Lokiarchaeota archaeon]
MESNLTQTIFGITTHLKIPAIILGGLALPAYNVFRTTLDVDICVFIKTQERLDELINALKKKNIITLQQPKIHHDLFTVFKDNSEAEIWLKPCDAFSWDQQMVEKIQHYTDDVFVLAIEDYILTKLARSDRSSIDIDDILQILINNHNEIDWKYLHFRIEWVNFVQDFKEILRAFEIGIDKKFQKIAKEIIEKFNEK